MVYTARMTRPVFFTVGPSEIFPSVAGYMAEAMELGIPSLSHRGKQFEELFRSVEISLKELFRLPDGYRIFFVSSGNEGMERFIENCVREKSGHIVYGAFSKKWSKISRDLGRKTEIATFPDGETPDVAGAVFSPDTEGICITQNETSTGGMIASSDIAALHMRYPDALIGVDIVSAAPVIELDFTVVDYAFFSVQKCFGLPAGLGVLIASPRALMKAEESAKTGSIGSYHNFLELKKWGDIGQTPETPNVLDIYLLSRVLQEMLAEDVAVMRRTIADRANRLYALFKSNPTYTAFVRDSACRSLTTPVLVVEGGSPRVTSALKEKGIIVGSGYGENKEKHIRIGNFPAHTEEHFSALLSALGSF